MSQRQAFAGLAGAVGIGVLMSVGGCSGMSAAMTGGKMAKNASRGKNYVRISLDGREPTEKKFKRMFSGRAEWEFKEPVPVDSTFRFRLSEPERVGRITSTSLSLYKEFGKKFSSQPEFVVASRVKSNDQEGAFEPNRDYDLARLPWEFRVLDFSGNETDGVHLESGKKYLLHFTVNADRSETFIVCFETK